MEIIVDRSSGPETATNDKMSQLKTYDLDLVGSCLAPNQEAVQVIEIFCCTLGCLEAGKWVDNSKYSAGKARERKLLLSILVAIRE